MKNNPKKKKFDAVAMMREIRDKLSRQYLDNPEKQEEDLAQIRKKYGIKLKERARANAARDWQMTILRIAEANNPSTTPTR